MNNQKDTQNTGSNTYGQSIVPDVKSLPEMPIYEAVNKKTEKLVTALYMVSDCMDTDDALKSKLRLLGVELLSDVYKLSTLSPMDKHAYVSVSLNRIHEILSFIEIACTIGFISEMNTAILKKEFSLLVSDLNNSQSKDKHFTFTLDKKMFDLSETPSVSENREELNYKNISTNTSQQSIKDMSVHTNERTSLNTMSFMNNKSPLQNPQSKKTNFSVINLANRQDRTDKIISLIRDKKDISIKDISIAFTDCSEKTIQRELNSLVAKGQIKKTGAKRWSRYQSV